MTRWTKSAVSERRWVANCSRFLHGPVAHYDPYVFIFSHPRCSASRLQSPQHRWCCPLWDGKCFEGRSLSQTPSSTPSASREKSGSNELTIESRVSLGLPERSSKPLPILRDDHCRTVYYDAANYHPLTRTHEVVICCQTFQRRSHDGLMTSVGDSDVTKIEYTFKLPKPFATDLHRALAQTTSNVEKRREEAAAVGKKT